MSLRHPSPIARRLLKIASLGLAGLLAGLLTGCNADTASLLGTRNDTGWQTSSTYASATASLPPRDVLHSAHAHPCYGAPCESHTASHAPTPRHRTM